MLSKKSQAAMEFLMTYGWALLLVLLVVVVLGFFGILDPARFLGDRCDLGTPNLICTDYSINSQEMTLVVKNSVGRDIYGLGINATDLSTVLSAASTKKGTRVRFDLNVTYNTSEAGRMLSHASRGKLIVTTASPITGHVVVSTWTGYGLAGGKRRIVSSYANTVPAGETVIMKFTMT